jgi:hypothetical protein
VRIEYRYNPTSDALELHREKVTIDFSNGQCATSSKEDEVTQLVRVDGRHDDAIELLAPAGKPDAKQTLPPPFKTKTPTTNAPLTKPVAPGPKLSKTSAGRKVLPLDPAATVKKSAKPSYNQTAKDIGYPDDFAQQAAPQQAPQLVPQPQAPPPQKQIANPDPNGGPQVPKR